MGRAGTSFLSAQVFDVLPPRGRVRPAVGSSLYLASGRESVFAAFLRTKSGKQIGLICTVYREIWPILCLVRVRGFPAPAMT